jgi:hypothetical protein
MIVQFFLGKIVVFVWITVFCWQAAALSSFLYRDLLFSSTCQSWSFHLMVLLQILRVECAGWKVPVYFYLIWLWKPHMPNVL